MHPKELHVQQTLLLAGLLFLLSKHKRVSINAAWLVHDLLPCLQPIGQQTTPAVCQTLLVCRQLFSNVFSKGTQPACTDLQQRSTHVRSCSQRVSFVVGDGCDERWRFALFVRRPLMTSRFLQTRSISLIERCSWLLLTFQAETLQTKSFEKN